MLVSLASIGDGRQQIAESAQPLGSRSARCVVGGEHAEIRRQAQLHGVGERERTGPGGILSAWHAALKIAADLDGAVDHVRAGAGRGLLLGGDRTRREASGLRQLDGRSGSLRSAASELGPSQGGGQRGGDTG